MRDKRLIEKAERQIVSLINQLTIDSGLELQLSELIEWVYEKGVLAARFKGTDGKNYQFIKRDQEYEFRQET